MSAANLILLQNLDCSNISFSEPKVNKGRATTIYLNYGEGQMPMLQTPSLRVAYNGMSAFPNPDTGAIQYSIELQINEEIEAEAFRKVLEFDETVLNAAVKNSKPWFKKKLDKAVCREFQVTWHRPCIDRATGEESKAFPGTLRFKLQTDEKGFKFPIYDMRTREEIPAPANLQDYVPKGSHVRLILKCGGLWVANGRFGCVWYPEQMQVEQSQRLTSCAFIRTGEEGEGVDADEVDLSSSRGGAAAAAASEEEVIEEEDGEVVESDGEE